MPQEVCQRWGVFIYSVIDLKSILRLILSSAKRVLTYWESSQSLDRKIDFKSVVELKTSPIDLKKYLLFLRPMGCLQIKMKTPER